MNIRKNIDYSEMYAELDLLTAKEMSQMELYCAIGKAVCRRTEKGAAVMASEYLNKHYSPYHLGNKISERLCLSGQYLVSLWCFYGDIQGD